MGTVAIWSELAWFMWTDFILKWSEVSYGEVLWDKSTMCIRATLHRTFLIILWLFHLGVSCTVFFFTCVMCGCFGNMCTCVYCVLYCLYCVFGIVSFMYILFVLSVLVYRLLPPSDNSTAVSSSSSSSSSSNNNNNNNNNKGERKFRFMDRPDLLGWIFESSNWVCEYV
jgi:hypothetical protein